MKIKMGQLWVLILLWGGCVQKEEPMVEEWIDGSYHSRTVNEYKVNGQRDGATTIVYVVYTLESREAVHLKLEVEYNPAPILRSGHWTMKGQQSGSGNVHAESLKFLGGQGEGPSLGGRFLLTENAQSRFRVVVPLRPVNKPKW